MPVIQLVLPVIQNSLDEEITVGFRRACQELASARTAQRDKDTAAARLSVSRCQDQVDALLDMYLATRAPGDRASVDQASVDQASVDQA